MVLAVFDTAGVLSCIEGANGLLAGPTPRMTLVVDCSTGDPDLLQARPSAWPRAAWTLSRRRCRATAAVASTRRPAWPLPWKTPAAPSTRPRRWTHPKLAQQIARAGRGHTNRLLAFHVCDWLTPTRDLLNDRGMMGDGVVELKKIRDWVEQTGFAGFAEVEIFSELDWWQRPGAEVLDTCIARHKCVV